MKWIEQFQLFLFDFDGLLVDTEPLHFEAFVEMLKRRGFSIPLDYASYCKLAHANAVDLRNAVCKEHPEAFAIWEELRADKTRIYLELLQTRPLELLPGVEALLQKLDESNLKRCVVTNSTSEQTGLIKERLPLLKSIPHWFTREQYKNPKPDPEGYLKAIAEHANVGERIIGFEDTPKGLQALKATGATAVLISKGGNIPEGTIHFPSFELIDI